MVAMGGGSLAGAALEELELQAPKDHRARQPVATQAHDAVVARVRFGARFAERQTVARGVKGPDWFAFMVGCLPRRLALSGPRQWGPHGRPRVGWFLSSFIVSDRDAEGGFLPRVEVVRKP